MSQTKRNNYVANRFAGNFTTKAAPICDICGGASSIKSTGCSATRYRCAGCRLGNNKREMGCGRGVESLMESSGFCERW